jgi:hypothetical protein
MLIFVLFETHLPPPLWLNVSWIMSSRFMACLILLFLKEKNQWAQWLPLDEWWYNTSYHTTTCMTPFEAVYGKNPPSVLSYMPDVSKVWEID